MWASRSTCVGQSAAPDYGLHASSDAACSDFSSLTTPAARKRIGATRAWVLRVAAALVIWVGLAHGAAAQEAETPAAPSDTTISADQSGATGDVPGSADTPTLDGAAAASAASGDDETGDSGSSRGLERNISSNAGFSESIPIAVPPFHGLEPALALSYNSGRGNGFVGVGWQLSGLSLIERASVRFGMPRYDDATLATDVFVWDGEELVACAQAPSSPGCTAGGTHARAARVMCGSSASPARPPISGR
jgi:Salmonella virulence plasmid 65kDa B protein